MNKSKLLKIIIAIAALVVLVIGGYVYKDAIQSRIARTAAVVSGQEIKPLLDSESRYIRQIVAQDNSTSRTIMWQSDSSEADAVIEYRLVGSDTTQTIRATDKAFTDDGSTTYIHEGTVTGLTPNTKYEYRVGYGNDRRVIGIRWKLLAPVCMMFLSIQILNLVIILRGSRLLRIPHIAIQGQPCILAWGTL